MAHHHCGEGAMTATVTHYVGTLTDITARKAAEDEIEQSGFL